MPLFITLWVAACLIVGALAISPIYPDDLAGLAQLFSVTGGSTTWKQAGGWPGSASSLCHTFFGIQCGICDASYCRVVGIFLSNNGLSGTLPSTFFTAARFAELYTVDLSLNQISGSIPTFSAATATSQPRLAYISLSANNLTGTIPAFGSGSTFLPQLSSLRLASNQLSGTLPQQLWSMPFLTDFDVSNNALTGTIPEITVSTVPPLFSLDFARNQFSGALPSFAAANLTLKQLSLIGNKFDTIPASLAQLKSISSLYPIGVRVADSGRSDPLFPGVFHSVLGVGCYTTSRLRGLGVADRAISSVEVPPNYRITLYSLDNFAGNSTIISKTAYSLWPMSFNDATSSACVQYTFPFGQYPIPDF